LRLASAIIFVDDDVAVPAPARAELPSPPLFSFDVETGSVYLEMQGSCAGCPSSSVTLQAGIENMLRHYIPEVKEVKNIGPGVDDEDEGGFGEVPIALGGAGGDVGRCGLHGSLEGKGRAAPWSGLGGGEGGRLFACRISSSARLKPRLHPPLAARPAAPCVGWQLFTVHSFTSIGHAPHCIAGAYVGYGQNQAATVKPGLGQDKGDMGNPVLGPDEAAVEMR
jgi:hypothetical protein